MNKRETAPTPAGWSPPPQWVPPPHFAARSVPLAYNPRRMSPGGLLFLILVTGLPGLLVPLVAVSQTTGWNPVANLPGFRWDGKKTFVCSGNDRKTISGVSVTARAVPAIMVDGNCTLTIEKSAITGEDLIEIRSNGQVEIRQSTLTFVGRRGLRAEGNRSVRITGSKLHVQGRPGELAPIVALYADGNKQIELQRTELRITPGAAGAEVVVGHVRGIGTIALSDSQVLVDRAARPSRLELLRVEGLGTGRFDGGWVDGGGLPLEVSGRKASVTGTDLRGGKLEQK